MIVGLSSSSGSLESRPASWVVTIAILILAIGIRLAYLIEMTDVLTFKTLINDAHLFHDFALEMLSGNIPQRLSDTNPLYPFFLAMTYLITAPDPVYPRIFQIVLDALTCLLAGHLARRYFGAAAGWLTAGFLAFYLPLIYGSGQLLSTTLTVFFCVLSAVAFEFGRSGRQGAFFLSGIALGLAILGRPNLLPVVPVLSLYILIIASPGKRSRIGAGILLFCLGTALPIFPVTWLNRMHTGEWVLVAAHDGINFYTGNHENAPGTYTSIPGISNAVLTQIDDSKRIAETEQGRSLTPGEVSKFWYRKSLRFMREHPVDYARLIGRKIVLFWNGDEIPGTDCFRFDRQFSRLLQLPLPDFYWLGPISLLGVLWAFRLKPFPIVPMTYLAVVMFSNVAFFVAGRYRMPAIPFLVILAGGLLVRIASLIKEKSYKNVLVFLPLLAISVAIVQLPIVEYNPLPGYRTLAGMHYRNGDPKSAEAFCRLILTTSESDEIRSLLGMTLLAQSRAAEALPEFERACALNPSNSDYAINRAVAVFQAGDIARAHDLFISARNANPSRYEPLYNLGLIAIQEGRARDASEYLTTALEKQMADPMRDTIRRLIERLRETSVQPTGSVLSPDRPM